MRFFFLFVGLAFLFFGCASIGSTERHARFTYDQASTLEAGLTPDEVIEHFGEPDRQELRQVGDSTAGMSWEGLVFIYEDEERAEQEPAPANELVFNRSHEPPRLNYWMLNSFYYRSAHD